MDRQGEPDPSPLSAAFKWAAGLTLFLGGFTTISASAHLEGVIQAAITKGYTYDFRLAALLIVGMALLGAGVLCIAGVRELARGHRIGWERAFYGTVLLVLVAMPLEPIQPGLAPAFTFLGGLNLFALLAVALLAGLRRRAGR